MQDKASGNQQVIVYRERLDPWVSVLKNMVSEDEPFGHYFWFKIRMKTSFADKNYCDEFQRKRYCAARVM